jgi:hypothetical protein
MAKPRIFNVARQRSLNYIRAVHGELPAGRSAGERARRWKQLIEAHVRRETYIHQQTVGRARRVAVAARRQRFLPARITPQRASVARLFGNPRIAIPAIAAVAAGGAYSAYRAFRNRQASPPGKSAGGAALAG